MRTFWIVLGVLVILGAAFAFGPGLLAPSKQPAMNSPPVADWPGKSAVAPVTNESRSTTDTTAATAVRDAGSHEPSKSAAAGGVPSKRDESVPANIADIPPKATEKVAVKPDPAKSENTLPENKATEVKAPAPADAIKKDEAVVEDVIEKALGGGSVTSAALADKKEELKQTPVKIERKGDNEVLLDGIFTVKGKGTKENPYIAPWELVIAAQETFDPGQKKDEIPGAVMFLDGKHVRLTGYACFPMYVPEPREMLSMLNQWDGCCIGVPPTPYDAIEVHLAKKVSTDDRYAAYGTVEGVFRVKPYLSGNWLVGLYLLEEATFKPSDKGGGS
jgi:hypothetical protein